MTLHESNDTADRLPQDAEVEGGWIEWSAEFVFDPERESTMQLMTSLWAKRYCIT